MQELAGVVDALVASLPGDGSGEVLMGVVAELETQIRRLQAVQLTCLEKVDRSGAAAAEHITTAAWLRSTLRLAGHDAHRRVHLARDLADALPQLQRAMLAGDVSVAHAQQAARLRRAVDDGQVRTLLDPALTDAAMAMSPPELGSWVTSAIHSLEPDKVADEEATAFARRELHLATTFGGIGVGSWTLDPVSQEKVLTAIHAASPPLSGDDRSPKQRRADGLIAVCEFFNKHATAEGASRVHAGEPPQVMVMVSLETLRGTAGSPTAVSGYGRQISGEAARRLACDAKVSRIISGPMSEIIDAGRSMRTFPAAARRAIVGRDRHCIWPGCNAPPAWCEAHHVIHWIEGGESNVDNGVLLCGRHHDRVHLDKRAIRIRADGSRTVDLFSDVDGPPLIDERPAPGGGGAQSP